MDSNEESEFQRHDTIQKEQTLQDAVMSSSMSTKALWCRRSEQTMPWAPGGGNGKAA